MGRPDIGRYMESTRDFRQRTRGYWSKVLFDEFDANGDGQLDEDEFIDAVVKAMLKFLDNGANEDDDLGDMEEMERDHQIEEMMLIIRKELPYLHV